MIFVWSGFGWIAALPILLYLLIVAFMPQSSADYGVAVGALIIGIVGVLLIRYVSGWLEQRYPPRELVDPQTGERVLQRRRDSLFFIPLRFLWVPYVLLALFGLVATAALLLG